MPQVTILGLGAMGSRIARRLIDAGHQVTVWNRTTAAAAPLAALGATMADTPAAATVSADFIIAMLRDDAASRQVWLAADTGAVHGLKAGAVAIESSTITPAWARTWAQHVGATGADTLDAPVLGSRPQAEAGQLIHLVGGNAGVLARAEPILAAIGVARHHIGPAGTGAALKLLANALFAIQVAGVAELLGRMPGLGLDAAAAVAALGATPVLSPAAKGAAALMLADRHEPLFPLDLVAKDLGYALAGSEDAMPITEATAGVVRRAVAAGLAEANLTSLARLYQN